MSGQASRWPVGRTCLARRAGKARSRGCSSDREHAVNAGAIAVACVIAGGNERRGPELLVHAFHSGSYARRQEHARQVVRKQGRYLGLRTPSSMFVTVALI